MLRQILRRAVARRAVVSTVIKNEAVRRIHCGRKCCSSKVELTSVRYPGVKRGNYAQLSDKHVQHFQSILPKERVITDLSDVESYNVDWLGMVRGASQVVLKPKTTEEVSAILKYCNAENLAVCPQGGNTGLVGGSVPVFDEVIISTSLMNKIISLDDLSGVLICQAGCILENLDSYLSDRGFMMPLDLGAKGTCQIGGNVSTNAGGIRLIRYGSLQGSVLGIEALHDGLKRSGKALLHQYQREGEDFLGRIVAMDKTWTCSYEPNLKRQSNEWKHPGSPRPKKVRPTQSAVKEMFIMAYDIDGVILHHAVPPRQTENADYWNIHRLEKFDDVLRTYRDARHGLGEILSSCEMMDALSLDAATTNLKLQRPIGEFPFYMLIETSGSNGAHDEEKLNKFLEASMANGVVLDGTVASEPSRIKSIWNLRESIPNGMMSEGHYYLYDVTLPLEKFYDPVPLVSERLAGTSAIRCSGFGHIGRSQTHFAIINSNVIVIITMAHVKFMVQRAAFVQERCYSSIWHLRESIPAGFVHEGRLHIYDLTLPMKKLYDLVPLVSELLVGTSVIRCCGFCHLGAAERTGDGNLHLNITSPEFDHSILDIIEPFVFEWTSKLKGSVSAEHGIGFKKTQYIHYSKSKSSLDLMVNIKKLMDPKGILNPYKVLPAQH
ncbi:hypothetical protein ANN_05383 [Periplaneta americana]|uniref:D-2-hydroxyglutarate dehydrogenase, mitochondrial n=1 Tax=Periplaneta americana TaxID=6978 RepID=A0ABQ8TBV2_PERAM|nr:hypothetical protein ANN_05383 [Periplaneta americana]